MHKFFVAAATLVLLASPVRADDALSAKMKTAGVIVGGLISCGWTDRAKSASAQVGKESKENTKSKEEYQAALDAFKDGLKYSMRPKEQTDKESCDKFKKLADDAGY